MQYFFTIVLTGLMMSLGFGQKNIEDTLRRYNKNTVDYIRVEVLRTLDDFQILDTRLREEYEVSHIKNAIWVGYKNFDSLSFIQKHPNREKITIVYCSVGVRSEDIGEVLIRNGYKRVFNLYGGIFKWSNMGFPVYDSLENKTKNVHAFGKEWSHLLTKADKVF